MYVYYADTPMGKVFVETKSQNLPLQKLRSALSGVDKFERSVAKQSLQNHLTDIEDKMAPSEAPEKGKMASVSGHVRELAAALQVDPTDV